MQESQVPVVVSMPEPAEVESALSLVLKLCGGAWAVLDGAAGVLATTGINLETAARLLSAEEAGDLKASVYLLGADRRLLLDASAAPLEPVAVAQLAHHLLLVSRDPSSEATGAAARALLEINLQLQTREFDLAAVLDTIVNRARVLLRTDVAWLSLVSEGTDILTISVASGIHTDGFVTIRARVGEGIGGLAVKEQRTIVVPYLRGDVLVRDRRVRNALFDEGLVSLICAPMLHDGRMLGALYLANRRPTVFPEADVALVSALAAQGSVAVANAQLYRAVVANTELLEKSFTVSRGLTELALRAAGVAELGEAISALTGREIVIEQGQGGDAAGLRFPGGAVAVERVDPDATAVPIQAGHEKLGRIQVLGPEPLEELERRTVEHGATLVALDMLRQRAAEEMENSLRAELLDEILAAAPPYDARLRTRARRFGLHLEQQHRMIIVELVDDGASPLRERGLRRLREATLRSVDSDDVALASTRDGRVLLVLRGGGIDRWLEVVECLRGALEASGSHGAIGISAPTGSMGLAYGQASACVRLSRRIGGTGATAYEDLGAMRFVLDSSDPAHTRGVVRSLLGALIDYDAETRVPLLPTLRAFLDANGHQATAAAACYVHVSTLKYRIRRIETVLGVQLSEPRVRFELTLGVRLAEVLSALGTVVAPSLEPPGAA